MKRNYVKVIAAVVGMTMVYSRLRSMPSRKRTPQPPRRKSPFTDMERLRRSP